MVIGATTNDKPIFLNIFHIIEMSLKRQATTELNHDNWDQEDPDDHEEIGTFTTAPKEVIEKRVIRTAKRRTLAAGDEPKKSVFSGFGGFNKTQPASFDFLSKLTNGNNANSGSTSKADSSVTSSLFSSKPSVTSPSTGIFGIQSTSPLTKSPFGSPSTQTSSGNVFGSSTQSSTSSPSAFVTSKADSTVKDSPFKIQTVTSSTDSNTDSTKSSLMTPVSSNKFSIPSNDVNVPKSLFASNSSSSPFKIQPVANANSMASTFSSKPDTASQGGTEKKNEDSKNEKKMKYFAKLKGLNESVSDWIKKHVEQTPLCILTPIFKDYEKYLADIQKEYEVYKDAIKSDDKNKSLESKPDFGSTTSKPFGGSEKATSSSIFNTSGNTNSLFNQSNKDSTATEKPGTFSFGIGSSTNTSSTITTSSAGFSFGTSSSASAPISTSLFSFTPAPTTTTSNGTAASFSFGTGKPFSFSANVQQNSEPTKTEDTNEDEEDAPPKVEFTPVVEENSVYDKRCKIFVKKDNNFVDKGVGTLYIKKVEETGKYQLLVRANTNLGTVLVNLILVSAIPTQRMGKNNVMMVCIPTPDYHPPPTPILIRVKTSDEADELLETLNKYKT